MIGRVRAAIANGVRGFGAWQGDIPDQGRVVLVGLLLLAAAFVAVGQLALALGVPAGILIAVGLGVDFNADRRAALVLIGAVTVVLTAVVIGPR